MKKKCASEGRRHLMKTFKAKIYAKEPLLQRLKMVQ